MRARGLSDSANLPTQHPAPFTTRRAIFWSYDPRLPSFRHRLAPLARELEQRGWAVTVDRFPKGRYVRRILARRRALASTDLLVFAKINLAPGERALLAGRVSRVVFDFDDAIWLGKPRSLGDEPGRSWFREHKFAASCRSADLVLAGNDFLATRARRENPRVEIAPTGIDLAAYAAQARSPDDGCTLVWIGLPENLPYLELLRPALGRLAARTPLRLRVVSSAFPDWPEVPIERVPWSEATQVSALAGASIGVMPLADDDWSRGKCAFKLLQYMAAGLPSVASPVGENKVVVTPNETGLLAASDEEWERALGTLLSSPIERRRLGRAGRESLRERFEATSIASRTADLVTGGSRAAVAGGAAARV